MTPRQRVVEHLLRVTRDRSVEQQLREQWLRELKEKHDENSTGPSSGPSPQHHAGVGMSQSDHYGS